MDDLATFLHGKLIAKEYVMTGLNTVEMDVCRYGRIDKDKLNSALQKRGLFLYKVDSWLRLFHRFVIIVPEVQ